ncbi:MAG: sensor histidine kinase [Planctomycetota bacterium]|jgi:signal transduction histidine kinase
MDERMQEKIMALVGGLAHEIKTPLSTIGMNLQLLREKLEGGLDLTDREKHALTKLQIVEKEVLRLGETLNEFLRFVRGQSIEMRPGSINLLVNELVDFVLPEAKAQDIRVHRNQDYRIPLFHFDFELVRQAVLNVLKNGLEAMRNGGDLYVETGTRGQIVILAISNTGPPISQEDRKKIFEPYFSTKPEGTGLGLSVARRALEDHGGGIEVAETALGGVRFLLHLPMDQRRAGVRDDGAEGTLAHG